MKEVANALYEAGLGAVGIANSIALYISGSLFVLLIAQQYFKSTFGNSNQGIDMVPILRAIIILFILQLYGSVGGSVVSLIKSVGTVNVDERTPDAIFKQTHEERLAAAQTKLLGALYEDAKGAFTNPYASLQSLSRTFLDIGGGSGGNNQSYWNSLMNKSKLTSEELKTAMNQVKRQKSIREREEANEKIMLEQKREADEGGIGSNIKYYFNVLLDKMGTIFSLTGILVNWMKEGITIMIRNVVVIVSSALLGFAFAVGPIPIALSIIPAFKDAWQRWLSSMISFGLWGLTVNILDTMSIGLSEYIFTSGMDEGNPIRYITVNIVMIVMYLATPRLSNMMLGSGGEFYSAMTAMAGSMAMGTAQQSAGMAASAGAYGVSKTYQAGKGLAQEGVYLGSSIISNAASGASSGAKSGMLAGGIYTGSNGGDVTMGAFAGGAVGGVGGLISGALDGVSSYSSNAMQRSWNNMKQFIPKHRAT